MAVQAKINFHGIEIPEAYIRIATVQGSKDSGWSGTANVYANIAAFEAKSQPIDNISLPIPPNANGEAICTEEFNPNAIEVLYMRIKHMYPTSINV